MTKALLILKYLLSRRRLKWFCTTLDLSYKYVYAIVSGKSNPSIRIIEALAPLIKPDYWTAEADKRFIKTFREVFSIR